MQIKKLERELGVELIERNPRHVLLTAAGEEVVARARVVLAEVDGIHAIARRAQDPESGSIRLGIFPTLAPYLLPHVIPRLHERFSKLELLLVEEKTHVVLQRLRDGQLDAGILALPVDAADLHAEPLFTEDFLLAVNSADPLTKAGKGKARGLVDLNVLADLDVLLLDEGHCLREQALSVCRLVGANERAGFRATSLETLRQMVAAGVGVTLLPELSVTAPVPVSPDVALLRFSDPVPSREVAMFWRPASVYGALLTEIAAEISAIARPLVLH